MWQLSAASQDFKKKTAYALVRNSSGTLDFLKFTFQNKFLPAVSKAFAFISIPRDRFKEKKHMQF